MASFRACSNSSIVFSPEIEWRPSRSPSAFDAFRSRIQHAGAFSRLAGTDVVGELAKKCHIAPMLTSRPFSRVIDLLRRADLRPTRQRLALAKLLFENGHRHVTAESLHEEALDKNFDVSLATVYNTLHQFVAAGLLREIFVDASRSYFDTNTVEHHHLFFEPSGKLEDIPAE